MSHVAQAMRELMALGVEGEALVVAIDRMVDAMLEHGVRGYKDAIAAASAKADAELTESAGARRTRRWRERRASPDASQNVTERHEPSPGVTSPDSVTPDEAVSPTPPSSNSTPSPPKGGTSPKSEASRRKPERPIPADFPTAIDIETGRKLCDSEGADVDVGYQAKRFRNHAEQSDRRVRDWGAAWRNWLLKAVESAPKRAQTGALPPPTADAFARRIQHFRDTGEWRPSWGPPPEASSDVLPFAPRSAA